MSIKLIIAAVLLSFVAFAGTPLTYQNGTLPYAANSVNVYLIWYGNWSDTTSQSIISDYVSNALASTPNIAVASLYPVGPTKQVVLNPHFTVIGQINQPYADKYDGGTPGKFGMGNQGEELLVGDLITAGTIPTPIENGNGQTNTYAIVLLAPGIASTGSSACAYSTFASNNYMVSTILDQTNLAQSCAGYLPLNNMVSGTALADLNIFAITAEATHTIDAHSWTASSASPSELCVASDPPSFTSPICVGDSTVCQYTWQQPGNPRYYFLANTYVNAPIGGTIAACAQNYIPPNTIFPIFAQALR